VAAASCPAHWRTHQQEGVPNVFVGRPTPCGHSAVHQVCDDVDKLHHSLLQDLCGVGEAADVTEPKHSHLHVCVVLCVCMRGEPPGTGSSNGSSMAEKCVEPHVYAANIHLYWNGLHLPYKLPTAVGGLGNRAETCIIAAAVTKFASCSSSCCYCPDYGMRMTG